MIASLPMYDLPEIRWATDALWSAMAEHLGVDGELVRDADWAGPWRDPDLVFSQTCGYPFTHEFAGELTYVATPHYDAEGCEGPLYCSTVLAREPLDLEQLRGKVAAINSPDSMSGMLALKLVFASLAPDGNFFDHAVETGSHVASLWAVQSGEADVCAIDCVTLALLRRHRPLALQGLSAVARSPLVPGLPYVTRAWQVPRLEAALSAAFTSSSLAGARDALLLSSYSVLPDGAYGTILQLERKILEQMPT